MASIINSVRNLFIPGKATREAHNGYQKDMQTLEVWSRQPIQQLVAGSGITLTPASGLATDSKGNGPFAVTIAAAGGGGVTLITSPKASITITNPGGPTVSIDVAALPFLNSGNYSDAHQNVGHGTQVFNAVPTGTDNTAIGFNALAALTTGNNNTAVGWNALSSLVSVGANTAVGARALLNATGNFNSVLGQNAGLSVTSGTQHVYVGYQAQGATTEVDGCVGVGYQATAGGSGTGGNAIAIGNQAFAAAAGSIAIGRDHTGVSATTTIGGTPVVDLIALGTANHTLQLMKTQTGAGSALLGANCPAATLSAPRGWFVMNDGTGVGNVFVPFWH